MTAAKAYAKMMNLCMQAFQEIPETISFEDSKIAEFPLNPDYDICTKITLTKGKKKYFFYSACPDEENCMIYNFDGVPVAFTGDCYYFLVFIEIWAEDKREELAQQIEEQYQGIHKTSFSTNGTCWLITFECDKTIDQDLIDELNEQEYVQLALQLEPVTF